MKGSVVSFQLGKQSLNQGFIELLKKTFKKHDLVKVNILKTCSRKKQEVKEMAEKICQELKASENKDFKYKIIGFTIFIRKWRRPTK